PSQKEANLRYAILFGVPGWQKGTTALPKAVRSWTNWHDWSLERQGLGYHGRGTGQRFYTTPNGVAGAAEGYERVGVYGGRMDFNKLADRTGWSERHIQARHARLKALGAVSARLAVATINASLGDVDFAVYDQPPAGRQEQLKRGIAPDAADRLIVIRNDEILFTKLGEITIPQTTE
ncbi:MAG: hypothetical protein ACREGB_00675, partial [Candidatus Saccharimonadales bacterium]